MTSLCKIRFMDQISGAPTLCFSILQATASDKKRGLGIRLCTKTKHGLTCCSTELALEATASLRQTLGVHDLDHTHSLVSFQCSWLSDQQMLLLTKTAYSARHGGPQGERGGFYTTVCTNEVRSVPASADQSRSTATQGSYHVHSMS